MSKKIRRLFALSLLLGIAALLISAPSLLKAPNPTRMWTHLFDGGHALIFGLLAVVVLLIGALGWRRGRAWLQYLIAFVVSAGIGVAIEGFQFFMPRDADLADVGRNLLGVGAFLLTAALLDRRFAKQRAAFVLFPILSLGLLLVAFFPALQLSFAYVLQNRAVPRICDFDSAWERPLYGVQGGDLELGPFPVERAEASGRSAHVTFRDGEYPHLSIRPPSDWRGYEDLVFETYSARDTVTKLYLRVHDEDHDERYYDRFNTTVDIPPGGTQVRIPLATIRQAPEKREMDLSRIRSLIVFLYRPSEPIPLVFDAFRLEPGAPVTASR